MPERDEEDRKLLEQMTGYRRKRAYRPVFIRPQGDWRVEANWVEAYYEAARAIIAGVVEGRCMPAVEGVTGLYLFRHYLELSLKYIILHARWLKDPETNTPLEEVAAVKKTHSLQELWASAKKEAAPKIAEAEWKAWDIEFLDAAVDEWHSIDPQPGERFRYHGKEFGGRPEAGYPGDLSIDFAGLLEQMPHAREVLQMIDVYLFETYGMNAEWEAEMASW